MADDDPWKLTEDGYLNVGIDSECIVYHPNLNIIIVSTKSWEVLVLDVNSGVILHKSSLSANCTGRLQCKYLAGCDKILFSDGRGIGVRRDYNGVVLLDTILQTPLRKSDDTVKLELVLSEAVLLQQSLRCVELPGIENTVDVIQELSKKVKEGQLKPKKGTKAQKWNTICLELPHYALKTVCAALVQELKRQNRHIPALSIASAVHERLNCLLPSCTAEGVLTDRALMFSEAARRDTFVKWPHMNYKWALPDQMAQAGFYHQPNSTGDDRAMCFTCNVCLVCWEPTDEPWSEHERHSPTCPFVKGDYTQNVPLSVTYATSPGAVFGDQEEEVDCIATSSVAELVGTATRHGLVGIWNVLKQLKKEVSFYIVLPKLVTARSQYIDSLGYSDIIKSQEAWSEKFSDGSIGEAHTSDVLEIPLADLTVEDLLGPESGCQFMELTAISIVGGPQQQKICQSRKKSSKCATNSQVSLRPCIVGGVSVIPSMLSNTKTDFDSVWGNGNDNSSMVRAMNDVNEASNRESASLDIMKVTEVDSSSDCRLVDQSPAIEDRKSLYLVVYDFHYHSHSKIGHSEGKDIGGGGSKTQSGKSGSSAKKVVSGTGTSTSSGTRQENNNMYQEIFLSKFLCDVPLMDDGDPDIVVLQPPGVLMEGLESPPASSSGGLYPSTGVPGSSSGSGTYDVTSVNEKFSTVSGEANTSNVPSSSEGSPPPLIKVHCASTKDNCGNNTRSVGIDNSNRNIKQSDPIEVQCISLPDTYKNRGDLFISGIYPTKDGGHLLVVLETLLCDTTQTYESNSGHGESVSMASESIGNYLFECSDNESDIDTDIEGAVGNFNLVPASKPGIPDGLVTEYVRSSQCFGISKESDIEDTKKIPDKDNLRSNVLDQRHSALLIYSLNFEDEVVKVDDIPLNVRDFNSEGECPINVTLLPLLEREDGGDSPSLLNPQKGCPLGLAALVCRDGIVRILDVATLKILSTAVPEKKGTKFVSAAYCNSLERLCACTSRGSLHFFMMSDEREIEEREEDNESLGSVFSLSPSSNNLQLEHSGNYELDSAFDDSSELGGDLFSISASSGTSSTSCINMSPDKLIVNRPSLGISELRTLYELTRYENLTPIYAATVPPCWIEIMQAQKQRRHPQHLQQGDDLQHTRSWRLQTDATSWDEHVFEITVPRSCCIGHVDVKFSLNSPCTAFPEIQFTLLKLNASGIGRKDMPTPHMDETIDFLHGMPFEGSSEGSVGNPVTSDEYMQDHNTEILCGPVNLTSCLDLSDIGGSVTLTSPKLHRIKGRTLLIHIKAVPVSDEQSNGNRQEKGTSSKRSRLEHGGGRLIDRMMEYLYSRDNPDQQGKKSEVPVGCDWLHEVSVTLRKTTHTTIPNERNQRCAMLESNPFVEKLLEVTFLQGPDKTAIAQSMALDILIWVASVRLSRLRTLQNDAKLEQIGFTQIIEDNLKTLIKHCILLSGRSIAHKCVKLIIICSDGVKNVYDSPTVPFDGCVLRALLEWLPTISCCTSAGALRWYFLLLSRVLSLDVSATTGHECVTLLQRVAHEMNLRSNPYHLLLRTRFGLYNTPLEPELFDVEAPVPAKFSSVPVTYATVVSGDTTGSASAMGQVLPSGSPGAIFASDTLDLKEILGPTAIGAASSSDAKGTSTRFKRLSSNHYMKGLLEVEPLHFKCHAASDGTKMEKVEPGAMSAVGGSVPVGTLFEPNNVITTSSGSKKADNDFISFYEDMKKEDPFLDIKKEETYIDVGKNDSFLDDIKKDEETLSQVLGEAVLELKEAKTLTEIFETIQQEIPQHESNNEAYLIKSTTDVIYASQGSAMDVDSSSSSSQQSSVLSGPVMYVNIIGTLGGQNEGTSIEFITKKHKSIEFITKKHESKKIVQIEENNSVLPWQQLLVMPPQHMLVIERMHSGARRFVVLDFGSPILLTDVLIPACSELVSLSIDIWCHCEETDGQRLVVASDIGMKSLVMNDLQPPPVCRYLKITAIGRYGMSTTKCKIPVGSFYGHIVILPGEGYSEVNEVHGVSESSIQAQLTVLTALFEDIHCRYSLACAKLQEFFTPFLTSEMPNVMHMHHYFRRGKDLEKFFPSSQGPKIISAYSECVTFQHQLNLIQNVVRRLESARGKVVSFPDIKDTQKLLTQACTDKLRVLGNSLLDILLYIVYEFGSIPRLPVSLYKTFDRSVCERLFHWLCVKEDTRMQLSACTLLVRMCGLQPWWGDFLANILSTFYSSWQTDTFPQDRVFILLTYMGRKSLASGASCRTVLDSVLRMLAELLLPLAAQNIRFLKSEMDLYQIEWVLLFLSVCLDTNGNVVSWNCNEEAKGKTKEKTQGISSRWDFMQGEIAIQRRLATSVQNTSSRSIRRKIQKRLMHHKQQLEDLEAAKKAFHASTQALSVLSSQAANLSSKLEAALKQQDQFFKKNLKQHSSKHGKDIFQGRRSDGPMLFNTQGFPIRMPSTTHSREKDEMDSEKDPNLCLLQSSCLPVAKGLLTFILQMDFTCNVDMFLLACKVIARIVASTRPAITLGELMTEDQLLHLVRLAVWNDQHKVAWGGPWASHTICCLLQDILDGVRLYPNMESISSEGAVGPLLGTSNPEDTGPERSISGQEVSEEPRAEDAADAAAPGTSDPKSNGYLPSLLESDDSDIEDFLDDIMEVKHNQLKKSPLSRLVASATSSISTALDARLEYGVEGSVDVMLRRLAAAGAYNLPLSVNAPIQALPDTAKQPAMCSWDDNVLVPWQTSEKYAPDTLQMLTNCFEKVFVELHVQNCWTNLELVLQLWLTLNNESACDPGVLGTFDPGMAPCIFLTPGAVSGLIAALAWHPGISLRAWCLAFQCLTMLANTPFAESGSPDAPSTWTPETVEDIENSLRGMAKIIIEDTQFVPMLLRFLSGSGLYGMHSSRISAGPSACQALHDLLVRLQMRCDVVTPNSKVGNCLKERLLKLVYQLIQPSGALANRQGPLDAQCKLIDMLINLNFTNIDLSTAMSILECVGVLVYTYILSFEHVQCRSGSEAGVGASTCFSGLLGSPLIPESLPGLYVSWECLMRSLLKLANKLVQTPLNSQINAGRRENVESTEFTDRQNIVQGSQVVQSENSDFCQTDEHKAAEQQHSSEGSRHQVSRLEAKVPCVADTVLQHYPTMLRLLSALTGCGTCGFALLIGTAAATEQITIEALGDVGEPLTVGDGIFRLLLTLSQKATSSQLILKPLFDFLSTACGSQPIRGGVGVMQLSEPLMWFILRVLNSGNALEEFNQIGGIKVICENLVKSNRALISAHPSLVSVLIQHFSSVSPTVTLHDTKGPCPVDTFDGLMNFAPLGTISSSNPTAQPADVLIHAAPPHRRARTPAWTYHFYPDEMWMDLTLTLPCAVLLKEIQLQPHLTSLATCPSAVAVEVSRDSSSGLVPLSVPVPTSGLTFIRLQLFQPEIVTSVLLRLYKPRDSSNIGLSQIRLLGFTTFGETFSRQNNIDLPGEELFSKTGLGWLRLLHHCINLPEPNSELAVSLLSSSAEVEGLLEACCGLLLIPAPSAFAFMPKLEVILLKLGLHNRELGLKQINLLLRKGPAAFVQGTWPVSKSDVYSSPAIDSVVDLLYQLCSTQDEATKDRVSMLLSWLYETANDAIQHLSPRIMVWTPSANFVHSVAAILWSGVEYRVNYDLSAMVTSELFSTLYKWMLTLPAHSALKRAIDAVLCSMCYIKPALFPTLLQRMGVLVTNLATHHSASISDDRKDHEPDELSASITDDSKELVIGGEQTYEKSEWYNHLVIQDLHRLDLNECQLMTLALACQSPPAIHQLLDSGLPTLLTQSIVEFCHREKLVFSSNAQYESNQGLEKKPSNQSWMTDADKASDQEGKNYVASHSQDGQPMLRVDSMAMVLNFFAEVCAEGKMRDWLGSPEGSNFWLPLLSLLCTKSISVEGSEENGRSKCELTSETYSALETATVKFFSSCCWCHPANQLLLSEVLCNVISQQKTVHQSVTFLHGVSGFTRRLVLQLLLENEKLFVFVTANFTLDQCYRALPSNVPNHPRYGTGHRRQLLYVSTQTTCADIIKNITDLTLPTISFETVMPGLPAFQLALQHQACPGISLPGQMALSQLLTVVQEQGGSLGTPCLAFTVVKQTKPAAKENKDSPAQTECEQLLTTPGLPTPLQVFTQLGGLALLAQHLPLVYPETLRYSVPEKVTTPEAMDGEWVKVEASDDIYEDLDDSLPAGSSSPGGGGRVPPLPALAVPPHSLAAFGLFLRLPGYAEVLLKDKKKAQCLLRLVLGVTDDGEGGDILNSPVATSLHTLPFQVLRELFDSTPLTTDDGVLLRRTTIDVGAVHLLLGCLSVFTHQSQDINLPGVQHELVIAATKGTSSGHDSRSKSDDKSHLYWAKGTGFGTGSTAQSWNVEQALLRQRSEEEHVTVLLQVLSSYINPGGTLPYLLDGIEKVIHDIDNESENVSEQPQLPTVFHELLHQSCLLPAVSSYLRNDSVLDMSRHIPLYLAVLELMRAMALSSQLVSLLLPQGRKHKSERGDELSVVRLLTKMDDCVKTYASRLKTERIDKPTKGNGKSRTTNKNKEEAEQDEGLARLIPEIQLTAMVVEDATQKLMMESMSDPTIIKENLSSNLEFPLRRSLEDKYLEVMKALQFDTFEMITECSEGFQFVVSYHFESNVRSAGDRSHPSRMKRLAQETVTLSTSLPLSYNSSVFVRCDADRLDIMKVLITGPAETPYANGCFEFDVYFPPDYPNSPMLINLETTGHHTVRFNPNLYNDGRVCLSVLNTWHGRPEEKWNAQTSSFLQVLVSIQSLILVPEPYFNEPGYERSRGSTNGSQSSKEYNSNICQSTVKWAMLEQVRNPCPCFREVIHMHFWMKRKEIITQIENWLTDMKNQTGDRRAGRIIAFNALSLERHFDELKEELYSLKTPEGLEDFQDLAFDLSLTLTSNVEESMDTSPIENAATTSQNVIPLGTATGPNGILEHDKEDMSIDIDTDTDIEMEIMVSKVCESL